MTRWIRLPERHPGVTIALVGLLFGVAYGASLIWLAKPGGRVVYGDALHHYVQLRSAVFDHDLRFTNEYVRMYGLTASNDDPELRWITDTNAGGYVRNLMPVGPAIVWAPGFLAVTAAVWLADASGASYPLDGYGRLFQASAAFSGIAAAVAGVWLAFLTAARLFRTRSAIWAALTIWFASSSVYYSAISPTYSHATSMLAVGAFWYVWIRTRDRQDVPALRAGRPPCRARRADALAGRCPFDCAGDRHALASATRPSGRRWRTSRSPPAAPSSRSRRNSSSGTRCTDTSSSFPRAAGSCDGERRRSGRCSSPTIMAF